MVLPVTSAASRVAATVVPTASVAADPKVTGKPDKALTKKPVPTLQDMNAKAYLQRQQIGAGLYDRSLTLREGAAVLRRQDAIQQFAIEIQQKAGGPTEQDLRRLARKLDRADAQIDRLSRNEKGADLDSLEGIDGRDLDIVQANLQDRIRHGLKDGSLTKEEGEQLLARQQELADVEAKLRASDGKLTAGEQKQMLDQLRKTADEINQARNNGNGVNLGTYDYAQSVTDRQNALEKQLQEGLKQGSLTASEAEIVRKEFEKVAEMKATAQANGKIDWREATELSSAMDEAEIKLYDLQRNTAGTQLAHSYVDASAVDKRQAQQLESITRGIDNGRLTNDEAEELLKAQQRIDNIQQRLADGGLTRSEYLKLHIEMNNFSLEYAKQYGDKDRYTGLTPPPPGGSTGGSGSTGGTGGSGSTGGTGGSGSTGGTGGSGSTGGTGGSGSTGGTGGSGSTGGTGGSGSTGGTGGVVTPPVSEAAPPPVAETPKPEEKPATPVAEPEKPAVAETENYKVAKLAFEEIKDRFGEWMSGVLRDRTNWVRDTHGKLADKMREMREDLGERDAARRDRLRDQKSHDHGGAAGHEFGVNHAEKAAKVASYAVVAAAPSKVESSLGKKVA